MKTLFNCFVEEVKSDANSLSQPKYSNAPIFPGRYFSNFLKSSYLFLLNFFPTLAILWREMFYLKTTPAHRSQHEAGRCAPSSPLAAFPVWLHAEGRSVKHCWSCSCEQRAQVVSVRDSVQKLLDIKNYQGTDDLWYLLVPWKKNHAIWLDLLIDSHFPNW